jgi:hypothetical protein
MASWDGGASWVDTGATAAPATLGWTTGALPAGNWALLDCVSSVEVRLLSDAMWLESRSDDALIGGANLALIGEELIQFGKVDVLDGRRFRLSRLLRGRRGTEWAAATHSPGEAFALIERDSIASIEPPAGSIGSEVRLLASGLGDGDGTMAMRTCSGEALRPPSPVHLRAARLPGGDLAINWVRRSRNGWDWLSGSDTPLGEEREAYRLELRAAQLARDVHVGVPQWVYSREEQVADGAWGMLRIDVSQIGTKLPSRPSTIFTDLGD